MPKKNRSKLERPEYPRLSYNSPLGKRRDIRRWRGQRVRNGFCFLDAINMSEYLAWVITGMLDYLAKHSMGYPGYPMDDPITATPDGWEAFLIDTSNKIKHAQALIDDDMDPDLDTDGVKQWMKGYEQRVVQAEQLMQEAFTSLGKYFYALHD